MAKATKTKKATSEAALIDQHPLQLGALLSTKAAYQPFGIWLIGDTPLITHAWSHKAKLEMLQKQVKATKAGREARDPQEDFVNSLYEMGDDGKGNPRFGFPVTGIKNAIVAAAHKDKGIAKLSVRSALWLNAEMVRTRPALAGAICDMPLVRIYGSKPEMREDMVRIGVGLSKTATLAYRAQFTTWAIKISGRFNPAIFTAEALTFLILESGLCSGIGEWRNERNGIFGSYHLANLKEQEQWEKFRSGKGPLPVNPDRVTVDFEQAAE